MTGRGVAYLLIEHPNELGGKTIESITAFTADDDEDFNNYHLLFTLTGPGSE